MLFVIYSEISLDSIPKIYNKGVLNRDQDRIVKVTKSDIHFEKKEVVKERIPLIPLDYLSMQKIPSQIITDINNEVEDSELDLTLNPRAIVMSFFSNRN